MFQAEIIWRRIKRRVLVQKSVALLASCSEAGGLSLPSAPSGLHGPVCHPCASLLAMSLSFSLLVPSLEKIVNKNHSLA